MYDFSFSPMEKLISASLGLVNRSLIPANYGFLNGFYMKEDMHKSLQTLIGYQEYYAREQKMFLKHNPNKLSFFAEIMGKNIMNENHVASDRLAPVANVMELENMTIDDVYLYFTFIDKHQPEAISIETVLVDMGAVIRDLLSVGELTDESSVLYSGKRVINYS